MISPLREWVLAMLQLHACLHETGRGHILRPACRFRVYIDSHNNAQRVPPATMRFLERILHDTLSLFVAKASERPAKAAPSPPPMDPQAASSTLQPESAPHSPPEQPCTAPPTPTSAMHKIAKRRPFRLYFSGPEGLDPTLKHVALFMMVSVYEYLTLCISDELIEQ